MVLIDRKFNEEQHLLETFFPKLHIERGELKSQFLKKLRLGGTGVLICCLGHHSQTFSALKLLPAHFVTLPSF